MYPAWIRHLYDGHSLSGLLKCTLQNLYMRLPLKTRDCNRMQPIIGARWFCSCNTSTGYHFFYQVQVKVLAVTFKAFMVPDLDICWLTSSFALCPSLRFRAEGSFLILPEGSSGTFKFNLLSHCPHPAATGSWAPALLYFDKTIKIWLFGQALRVVHTPPGGRGWLNLWGRVVPLQWEISAVFSFVLLLWKCISHLRVRHGRGTILA